MTIDNSQIPGPLGSHSVWTFTSAPTTDPLHHPSTLPPIVQLDYQPVLDTLGYARAHLPMQIGLHAQHLIGLHARDRTGPPPPPERYLDVRLSYSTDHGAHWHALKLIGVHGGSYLAIVPGADLVPGGAISLHGTATDRAGNAIDQTMTDLIPVR